MTKYQVLFTEKEIQNKVSELAYHIKKTKHEEPPVFICVLNGAFMFFTDLVKQIDDCYIDFIRAKSYTDTTQGEIRILKSIDIDIKGKDVYLIDDIYDSGNTMNRLIKHLNYNNPKSITPITLFKRHTSKNPDLIYGFDLENEYFLVGYGLDGENDLKRNQKFITGMMNED
jgi:hypoxanthine phosphoribosyltransferase